MPLKKDLSDRVLQIFREPWTDRVGQVVPDDSSIRLSNDGVYLDAVVLYADMAESSNLVDNQTKTFSAEIYKSYLHCAALIIKSEGGVITAYDGDRIMAVFIGDSKNTSALRAALKINYAVIHIINPSMKTVYSDKDYALKQVVGIDSGQVFVAKTGIRGANDLVWVGRPANRAAKFCSIRENGYFTYISAETYNAASDSAKFSNGISMWENRTWSGHSIYRSSWWWSFG